MIIQVHITDDEIKAIAEAKGWEWKYLPFIKWRSFYHNKQEPVEEMELCIKIDGNFVKAKDYIELTMKNKMIEL